MMSRVSRYDVCHDRTHWIWNTLCLQKLDVYGGWELRYRQPFAFLRAMSAAYLGERPILCQRSNGAHSQGGSNGGIDSL